MIKFGIWYKLLICLCFSVLAVIVVVTKHFLEDTTSSYKAFEINVKLPNNQLPHDVDYFYTDDVDSFMFRKIKEREYQKKYAMLTEADLLYLNKKYYRNITTQWHRQLLPPIRPMFDEKCLDYLNTDYKVTVSIIIVFQNEPLILLLRTLTTLVHRTSPRYLKEIILVDDKSDDDVSDEIQDYCRTQRIPLVFKRNDHHLGISRSRKNGILMAKGDVVAILDSHIEVMELWLEPLLSIITRDPATIAVPCIHMISEDKMSEDLLPLCHKTKLQFGFGLQQLEPISGEYAGHDIPSSALLGGDIVANRQTLLQFYPTPLITKYWDAENNRLSIRSWLCGNGIYINMCSNIVHSSSSDAILSRYTKRDESLFVNVIVESVAEILNLIPTSEEKETFLEKALGQKELIQKANNLSTEIARNFYSSHKNSCREYSYYINNVTQNHITFQSDQFVAAGEIQSIEYPSICLSVSDFLFSPKPCHSSVVTIESNHLVGFTKNQGIRVPDLGENCLDTGNNFTQGAIPTFRYNCHVKSPVHGTHYPSQVFTYDNETKQIVHGESERCLELVDKKQVMLYSCLKHKRSQMWRIRIPSWFKIL